MPQIFQVLRCYECQVFQVHQTKKSSKWKCKMCGEKQSSQKVHGSGSGADCRKHVQKLNMLCGELKEDAEISTARKISPRKVADTGERPSVDADAAPSKWGQFLDVDEDFHDDGTEVFMTTTDRKELKKFTKEKRKSKAKKRSYEPCDIDYSAEFCENEPNFNPADFGPNSFIAKFTAMSSRFSSKISGIKKHPVIDEHSVSRAAQSSLESQDSLLGEKNEEMNFDRPLLPNSPQPDIKVVKVTKEVKKRKAESAGNSSSSKWSKFIEEEEEEEDEEEELAEL